MFNSNLIENFTITIIEKQRLISWYKKLLLIVKNKTDREQISAVIEEETKHINILKSIIKIVDGQLEYESLKKVDREVPGKLLEKIVYSEIKIIKIIEEILVSTQEIRIKNGL